MTRTSSRGTTSNGCSAVTENLLAGDIGVKLKSSPFEVAHLHRGDAMRAPVMADDVVTNADGLDRAVGHRQPLVISSPAGRQPSM